MGGWYDFVETVIDGNDGEIDIANSPSKSTSGDLSWRVCFSFKMEKESDAAVYEGHEGTEIGETIVAIVEKEGKGKYGCVST